MTWDAGDLAFGSRLSLVACACRRQGRTATPALVVQRPQVRATVLHRRHSRQAHQRVRRQKVSMAPCPRYKGRGCVVELGMSSRCAITRHTAVVRVAMLNSSERASTLQRSMK